MMQTFDTANKIVTRVTGVLLQVELRLQSFPATAVTLCCDHQLINEERPEVDTVTRTMPLAQCKVKSVC